MFSNLHNHSNYSYLDGLSRIQDMVAKAKELGQTAIAITEHGHMSSYLRFYMECKRQGIKPIIGLEVYTIQDSTIKQKKELDRLCKEDESWLAYAGTTKRKRAKEAEITWGRGCHLILLAKNEEGLKNLFRIASYSATEGFYYKPLVDRKVLKKYSKGIIASSACLAGDIPQLILKDRYDLAEKLAVEYSNIFEDFYLELQPSKMADQIKVNIFLKQISRDYNIPLICTSDSHYVNKEDWENHDFLLAMQMKAALDDPERLRFPDRVYYLHSEQDMIDAGMPQEAIDNTGKIADMCDVEIDLNVLRAPVFPDTKDAAADLSEICKSELMSKYLEHGFDIEPYSARLDYELSVINGKGLSDYFLIVRDFLLNAQKNGIYVGPGRGSAAGSLLANLAGITKLDPIKYGLLFERFLNPERKSYPDIDVDIEKSRRNEVIRYIINKYGADKVCHVGTYSMLKPKSALKDVGRVLNIPVTVMNIITSTISDTDKRTLAEMLKDVESDKRLLQAADTYPRLFELASVFEGAPRQTGVGASGIIISPTTLTDIIPLTHGSESDEDDTGIPVAQLDTEELEKLGFIKFDILGLRTLDVIRDTVDQINKKSDKKISNIWDFAETTGYADPKAYETVAAGDADGIFQLESTGMRQVVKDLHMRDFDALTATVALYRPGPMALIPSYTARYRGYEQITYAIPQLEPILKDTQGIIVYQEQVMIIARQLAGYTPGQADMLRKAMGKKKKEIMQQEVRKLVYGSEEEKIDGMIKRGIDEKEAMRLGETIDAFGEYAFNKAHAASYAVISYVTAWLKAYFTKEYMAANFSSIVADNGKKKENISQYIDNFKSRGYRMVSPDVNLSDYDFTVEGNNVRFGFSAIRDFGDTVKETLQKHRPFESIEDFVNKVYANADKTENMSAKQVNALIFSGALDSLMPEEERLQIYNKVRQLKYNTDVSFLEDEIKVGKDAYSLATPGILPKLEEIYLGMPVKLDVMDCYKDEPVLSECPLRKEVALHGLVLSAKAVKTKDGKDMAFVGIRCHCGSIDSAIFGEEFEKHFAKIEVGNVYKFTLFKGLRNGADSYIIKKITRART